jgi:hypothetical protein
MIITPEEVSRLRAAHPGCDLHFRKTEFAEVVLRPASLAEYERFLTDAREPAARTTAMRRLVSQAVVYPDDKEFGALVERYPAIVQVLADEVIEISGGKAVTERKKL